MGAVQSGSMLLVKEASKTFQQMRFVGISFKGKLKDDGQTHGSVEPKRLFVCHSLFVLCHLILFTIGHGQSHFVVTFCLVLPFCLFSSFSSFVYDSPGAVTAC